MPLFQLQITKKLTILYNIFSASFEDLCELPEFEDPCGNGGACRHLRTERLFFPAGIARLEGG